MRVSFLRHAIIPVVSFLFLFLSVGAMQLNAATIYGITSGNQLVQFGATTPGNVLLVGTVTGLQPGESIIGIDFRPNTGQLYALGSNSRIYTINKNNAVTTFVGTLTTPLNGTNFGFDFNPVADRIRIVSDADQDLRANPSDGSNVVDGTLAYAVGDPNFGANPAISGAAYTNSFVGTTSTTLYDIDTDLNILVSQNPPNAGTLNTIGPLGVDASAVVGFDHTAASNIAYASLMVGGNLGFYNINLTTGAATLIGSLGNQSITDISVEIGTSASQIAYGLTTTGQLVRFNTKKANTPISTVAITGLQIAETLQGIDFRPATGELFGFGSTPAGATGSLYRINQLTGAATFVGTVNQTTFGTAYGFDFNPTVDRIRIVSDQDINRRANPADAVTIADGTLAFAAGDPNFGQNPNIVAAGYTNSFGGATSTALFDIDSNLDILAQQNPANAGTLLTIGGLTWNTTANAGLDITPGNNTAFAALELNIGGSPAGNSGLYQVNLSTGTAAFIAPIGTSAPIISIAIGGATSATDKLDFDGDGRADLSVFRLTENNWYIQPSSGGSYNVTQFGLANTDSFVPGDYDGDGRTDIAVWRNTNGAFYVFRSSDAIVQFTQFGSNGDQPVARDYDGDGRTDHAVVRQHAGNLVWYIINSSNSSVRIDQYGLATDFVAPGDYDGDGRYDLSVFRNESNGQGTFYITRSSGGQMITQFGLGSDLVVPGDYDGDGRTDLALLRQGSGYVWHVLRSSDGTLIQQPFGSKPHLSTQADYDGDGKTDISIWDPLSGDYFTLRSTDGNFTRTHFGSNGDYPIANYDTH